MALFVAFEQA
jgi:hypothetical protein